MLVCYCNMVGLDAGQLQFSWEPTTPEEMQEKNASTRVMYATLLSSSGIIQDKQPEKVDLEKEIPKWNNEFGEAGASRLTKLVQDSMPDYNYLHGKRLV